MSRPPTISDVARQAGVSIATVSRVLNTSSPVHPETARRVQKAIEDLNYIPSAAARILAGRKTHTIGLMLPEISGTFFQPMLRGIEAGLRQSGYDLLIYARRNNRSRQSQARFSGEQNTDGLIVFPGSLEAQELTHLWRTGFPVVLLHQSPPRHTHFPVITIENKYGARIIIEHLIQIHQRSRIAFLRGPEGFDDSEWRERGYREALKVHNIPFDEGLVSSGGFDEREARGVIESWLRKNINMDAIFCGNDDAAIGVMDALQQAGKRIPQDVSVVGFDDVPVASFLTPPLTTIRAPIEMIGYTTVMELLRLVRGEQVEPLVMLPVELVIRQSCGCHLST
jgi:LacI family transcriptional regulator